MLLLHVIHGLHSFTAKYDDKRLDFGGVAVDLVNCSYILVLKYMGFHVERVLITVYHQRLSLAT